jgi:ATP-binding cassette subfamily B protein
LIFQGTITLGQFFSLLFYSFFVFSPLGDIGTVAQQYQEAKASLERLDLILKTPPEKKPENPVALESIKTIVFKDVNFHYPTAQTAALEQINFQIRAGQSAAFAGPSGSGKTTIIKLLVGLYAPTAGTILFNDQPLERLDLEKLRNKIGLVSQDTQLFAGTIRENLLFASPQATDTDCQEALKAAAALTIIERGDQGLDTRIGEGGLKLSGGEKQRLAIARALLRNPDLIIFDEATSSLDSLTEQEITQTIKSIKQGRPNLITVLVAHRLSTIAHADTLYILEKGRIAEQGRHDELLSKNGLYSALWRQQIASTK